MVPRRPGGRPIGAMGRGLAMADELWRLTARAAKDLLDRREVAPIEMVEACARRIEQVDGAVNAAVTRCFDRARDQARRLEASAERGLLGGLPILVKDLSNVAGVRSTQGSPIFADHVPDRSDLMVERLEAEGAIVMGKSNTPEFGAGANTFNEVFGKTLNPWNTDMTCGGSSGGAAVALATGQVPLATGSDLGGSLRTPASFCSVVGFRPSPGRCPAGPRVDPFENMGVVGPMARNVGDVALMLDAMAGHDPEDPLSYDRPAQTYRQAAERPTWPGRIGFSLDLGFSPLDPRVRNALEGMAAVFAANGVTVSEDIPDLSPARDIFQTLRAANFATSKRGLLKSHRAQLKPEVIWNIEKGLALGMEEIADAQLARGDLVHRMTRWFESNDLLVCPAAMAPPFDVEIRYLEEVDGVRFDNYVDWMMLALVFTPTSCPALSLPCSFTEDGLPVGLQLIAPPRREDLLLSYAAALENVLQLPEATPIDPRGAGA